MTTDPDPRDRFVGKWKLDTRRAPWFAIQGKNNVHYNADGDVILHIEIQVGISKWFPLKKWVDSGFARVDEDGVFRCTHTKDHLEFHIDKENKNEACIAEYLGEKVLNQTFWIREEV